VALATTSYTTGSGGGGASALEELVDVKLSNVASGNILVYDGTHWVNKAQTEQASSAALVKNSVSAANAVDLVYGTMADNDFFRIRIGGTASDSGYVEFATADNGNEPIYFRQYSGTFSTLTRTATILDASGNTTFPGTVTANAFSGPLNGNATSATTATYLHGSSTTKGSADIPIYLSNGTATACTGASVFSVLTNTNNQLDITIAGKSRSLTIAYASASGAASYLHSSTTCAGSTTLPIYLKNGVATACTKTDIFSSLSNSSNKLSITVAGETKTLTVAYATAAGTADAVGSDSVGSSTLPVYFNSGKPTVISKTGVTISITGSSASCTGNAETATTLKTARSINGTDFDGSSAITTSKWGLQRYIYITDNSSSNTGTGILVDGSGNATLKLPPTIKAALDGNATTATTLKTARTIWGRSFDGSANVSGALESATTGSFSSNVTVGGSLTVSSTATIKGSAYQILTLHRSSSSNVGSGIRFENENIHAVLGFAFGASDAKSYFAIDIGSSSDLFKVDGAGNATATGEVTAGSDIRFK
jgi:hypothetical protein